MRFGGDEFICLLSREGLHGVRDRSEEESLDELVTRADHPMITQRPAR